MSNGVTHIVCFRWENRGESFKTLASDWNFEAVLCYAIQTLQMVEIHIVKRKFGVYWEDILGPEF